MHVLHANRQQENLHSQTMLRLDAEPAFVEVKNLSVDERNKIVEESAPAMWAVKLLVSYFAKGILAMHAFTGLLRISIKISLSSAACCTST